MPCECLRAYASLAFVSLGLPGHSVKSSPCYVTSDHKSVMCWTAGIENGLAWSSSTCCILFAFFFFFLSWHLKSLPVCSGSKDLFCWENFNWRKATKEVRLRFSTSDSYVSDCALSRKAEARHWWVIFTQAFALTHCPQQCFERLPNREKT